MTSSDGGISVQSSGVQSKGEITIQVKGNVTITNGGVGNSTASSAKNISITSTAGTLSVDQGGISSKGNVTLAALTLATLANVNTSSGPGSITITADDVALTGAINAGTSTVTIKPKTKATAIDLGTNTNGKLSLTDAELDKITASTITIGSENSGAITISAALDQSAINTLQLIGNTSFAANSGYTFQIGGTTAGTQHDQIQVTGTVTIDSTATLTTVVANSFVVGATDTFAVLLNDSTDAISGTFSGLPNNGSIANFLGSGTPGAIRYDAGTGNDIVIAKNQPPVVTEEIDDQEPNEDAEFSLSVGENFSDPDVNDTLTFTATKANGDPLPAWLSFNDETQRFTGIPTNDDVGSFDVKVTATDPKNASVSDTFTITVINTNDLPTITADNDGVVATGGSATNTGTWDDVDVGDTVTLTASVGNVIKNNDGTCQHNGHRDLPSRRPRHKGDWS